MPFPVVVRSCSYSGAESEILLVLFQPEICFICQKI